MSGYVCTFERIGRTHTVPPLVVDDGDADEIAFHVYNYARKYLLSRDVEVVVNLAELRGTIYAGMHLGGSFTLAARDA